MPSSRASNATGRALGTWAVDVRATRMARAKKAASRTYCVRTAMALRNAFAPSNA
jgi:hypothetical protein